MKKREAHNKLTLSVAIDFATSMGGECLSKEYVRAKHSMKWRCQKGHVWTRCYDKIKNKNKDNWCPECVFEKIRFSLIIANDAANRNNGKCLSEKYKNSAVKMKWECGKGHVWFAALRDILRGNWCKECYLYNMRENILERAREIAISRNGRCLSPKFTNCKTKLLWECENKHTWPASLYKITEGCWCPECKESAPQQILKAILKQIFVGRAIKSGFKGFNWLKTRNGKQELDIYIPELKLAIEFDGIQHFKNVEHFGGAEKFRKQKRLDIAKNKKILRHPEDIKYFIRFNYKEKLIKQCVIEKLRANDVPILTEALNG